MDTQGVFFLVLSVCVLWLTFFLCWALWHAVGILRNANQLLETARVQFERAFSLGAWLKSKLFAESAAGFAGLVGRALSAKLKKRK